MKMKDRVGVYSRSLVNIEFGPPSYMRGGVAKVMT